MQDVSSADVQPLSPRLSLGAGESDAHPGSVAFDHADFEAAFEAHYSRVCWYALAMLHDANEAEEAAAETFDRAYRAWKSGKGPNGPPLPWLLVICRRIVLGRRRQARLIAWLPLPERDRESAGDGGAFEAVEFRLWLRQLESILSAREREALSLRYLDDLGDAGAALVLGISPSGFRTLVSRAIAKLRTHPELWKLHTTFPTTRSGAA
jgi:RNA polymerase sigma factor (sigma-70 family)